MFRLILVATVVIAAGADPIPFNGLEIVGGRTIDITEAPYQLSLLYHGTHVCGASVLSTTRALTAAHCTALSQDHSIFSIRAGSSIRGSGGQVSRVSRVYQHPRYNPNTVDYDVAVLILASPLRLGPGVQPIALQPAGQEIPDGTSGSVSGWGTLSWQGELATKLQMVEVPKTSDSQCQKAYPSRGISSRMTCYGFEQGGKDSCQGDSGGPLVVNGKQVGIVSWGGACAARGSPGVYAKISNNEVQQYINTSV